MTHSIGSRQRPWVLPCSASHWTNKRSDGYSSSAGGRSVMNREVLLIEDESHYRASIRHLFRDKPYRFIEADSPTDGIEKITANPQIHVILLDLSFHAGNATDVLEYIKDRSHDYRVIILTGHDELLRAERAREYDVFNYLPKAERSSSQAIRFSVDQAFKDLERE